MGNHKLKWTPDEEAALLAGIAKHGPGKWKNILRDAQFSSDLVNRSNIDLKDKWRNMSVSASGERPKSSSSKSSYLALSSTTKNLSSGSARLTAPTQDATTDAVLDDSLTDSLKSRNGSEFNSMIFDALKASNSSKGSYIEMIVSYIEERYEAPPNLKRLLGSKLRRLVAQGKLNKVENRYTIRNDCSGRVKGVVGLNQKQNKPHHPPSGESCEWLETIIEASETAAYKIAVAERKSFLAGEAVKEADRVSELAEESDRFLEIVKDIYERCNNHLLIKMRYTCTTFAMS